MENSVEKLTEILEKEVRIHDNLLQTAGSINKSIKDNNTTALNQQTSQYDEQIFQLEKMEEQRIECCGALMHQYGFGDNQPVKLARIIGNTPASRKARLEQVQAALRKRIQELANINTSNRILLEDSLGIIENTFSMIRKAANPVAGYRQKGIKTYSRTGSSFLNTVA